MESRPPSLVREGGVEWGRKAAGNNILTSLAHNQSIGSSLILKRQKGEERFMFKMANLFIVTLRLLTSCPIVRWEADTNKNEVWLIKDSLRQLNCTMKIIKMTL